MRAYHFLATDFMVPRLNVKANPGLVLKHDGRLVLCESGLHASVRAIDALQYAQSECVSIVECSGEIVQGDDKLVCTERTVIAVGPIDLRAFARWCALSVAHLWDMPAIVREYLTTGDESKRDAARAATWAAARDAARDAARAAAWDAAWAAARDAAWDAAWAAAWAAARDAARDAAWDAAWAAAWAAAGDAARAAQNAELERRIVETCK